MSYNLLNTHAGGALGEYLGWLFQALWVIGITALLARSRVIGPVTAAIGAGLTTVWAVPFLDGPFVPALTQGPFGTAGFTAYGLWFCWLGAVGLVLLRPARTPAGAR